MGSYSSFGYVISYVFGGTQFRSDHFWRVIRPLSFSDIQIQIKIAFTLNNWYVTGTKIKEILCYL
jgi:hypothetical protein